MCKQILIWPAVSILGDFDIITPQNWGAGGQKQLNSVSPIVLTKLCLNQGEHLRYEEISRPLAVQLINL